MMVVRGGGHGRRLEAGQSWDLGRAGRGREAVAGEREGKRESAERAGRGGVRKGGLDEEGGTGGAGEVVGRDRQGCWKRVEGEAGKRWQGRVVAGR